MPTRVVSKISSLLAGLLASICIFSCGRSEEARQVDQANRDRAAKFAAARLDLARKPANVDLAPTAFIKGKVVMLSTTNGDEPGFQIAPALTAIEAMTPEEVDTVVLQECRSTQKGVYRTTDDPPREMPATAIDCEVFLIDRAARKVYFSKVFHGKLSDEPSVSMVSNSVANRPDQEINAFLAGLPTR